MAVSAQMRAQVSQLYVAMFGRAPDGEGLGFWVQQLSNGQSLTSVADTMFAVSAARAYYPSFMTNSEMVTSFYTKVLGRTPDAEGLAFWTAKLNATGATPGSVINQLITAVTTYAGTDAAGVASKALFMNKATVAQTYGESNGTVAGATTILGGVTSDTASVATATALVTAGSNGAVTTVLTTGVDTLTGTSSDDIFKASILNNANTLQSGDVLSGGAGNDSLKADIGNSQAFAISAETSGIETVAIRAQAVAVDSNNNNMTDATGVTNTATTASYSNQVQIDAQRMQGVTQWESNNSRADVVIEDVRILDTQITKDITIAMVETDPGHVDFGVYFDQYSLRSQSNTSSVLTLQLMDTRSNAAGTGPLKDNPYSGFAFYLTAAGSTTPKLITVSSKAIDDALTYADLLTAIKAAVAAVPDLASFTVALGSNFTVSDTLGTIQTGQTITLTSNAGGTVSATGTGTGWVATGTVPASSGLHTNISTAITNTSDLVTSKIILDDVGRGSTGGDLVVGGLSVGDTSTSLGVQRFEIEVRDNSKLETINSTNNTLREVTIKSGVTTSSSFAYQTTVKDAGNLTVNGVSGTNGANVTNGGVVDGQLAGQNAPLPGSAAQTARNYGFSDVRLIDASEFKGKLAFSAEVTQASVAKYLNLKDIAALPAGDNVAFTYTGGLNDDTMFIHLDGTAAGSRNTIKAGREDFTFTANGGAGDDAITLTVVDKNLIGGTEAWYTNQQLNKNIFVNGGDGNDTIRTPGAGDVIIDGGAGNDTIYTDNTGTQAGSALAGSGNVAAAAAYTAASAAELAAAITAATAANATDATVTTAAVTRLTTLDADPATAVGQLDAAVIAAITAAAAAGPGAITAAQAAALNTAYGTAVAGNVTAAELAAGDALLAGYLTTARAADAVAKAADITAATHLALLNATQTGVLNSTLAINSIPDATKAAAPANLLALVAAVPVGTTVANVAAATAAAVANGSITAADKVAIDAASVVANPADAVDAAEFAAMTALITPLQTAAAAAQALATTGGTATQVANLTALQSAIVVSTADAAVATATAAAVANGSITAANKIAIDAASIAAGAGNVDATELAGVTAILAPLLATANVANAAANTALTNAVTANAAAVNTAADSAAGNPAAGNGVVAAPVDAIGSTEAAANAALAATAATAAATALTTASTQVANLASLKAAIVVGTLDHNVGIATQAAVANLSITAAQKVAIDAAGVAGAAGVDLGEKGAVDVLIDGYVVTANAARAINAILATDTAAIANITATASAAATAAAALTTAGAATLAVSAQKGTYVFNTANQLNVSTATTAGYNLAVNDERNGADLKSDASNSYNLYQSQLTVNFKGIAKTVTVNSTDYKTSDLQVNQAIKDAINNDAVLSKLLVATDGPANTLVVTSLIDGVLSTADLVVSVAVPAIGILTTADVTALATAYGLTGVVTETTVLAAMATAKIAFDTKADYIDQLAETGAGAGNAVISGGNSVSSSDNTVTGGAGNDVIVLGTTVGLNALTSSNEKVVFASGFGNDTIVNFAATGMGMDTLDLTALKGSGAVTFNSLSLDKSIVVALETATVNDTTAKIAALFTDSATAMNHVYIAYDAHNVGKVYMVADAAGTGTGSVTASLVGMIDLADTGFASLTAANFA